jgi:hypothetical protein
MHRGTLHTLAPNSRPGLSSLSGRCRQRRRRVSCEQRRACRELRLNCAAGFSNSPVNATDPTGEATFLPPVDRGKIHHRWKQPGQTWGLDVLLLTGCWSVPDNVWEAAAIGCAQGLPKPGMNQSVTGSAACGYGTVGVQEIYFWDRGWQIYEYHGGGAAGANSGAGGCVSVGPVIVFGAPTPADYEGPFVDITGGYVGPNGVGGYGGCSFFPNGSWSLEGGVSLGTPGTSFCVGGSKYKRLGGALGPN